VEADGHVLLVVASTTKQRIIVITTSIIAPDIIDTPVANLFVAKPEDTNKSPPNKLVAIAKRIIAPTIPPIT